MTATLDLFHRLRAMRPRSRHCWSITVMAPRSQGHVFVRSFERRAKCARVGARMSYRNKTYVAFASEDIKKYYMMEAWRENQYIDFSFFDAHDLFVSLDTSQPETIKRNLRERMKNAKQVVLLGSSDGYRKGSDGSSFLAHEIKVLQEYNLPVVVANLDQDRTVDRSYIPKPLLDNSYYTVSTSFQPKIIQYALEHYAPGFARSANEGPHQYPASIYTELGL